MIRAPAKPSSGERAGVEHETVFVDELVGIEFVCQDELWREAGERKREVSKLISGDNEATASVSNECGGDLLLSA